MGFDGGFKKLFIDVLCLIILDNVCIFCIIVVVGIELVDVYFLDIVIVFFLGKEVYDLWVFYFYVVLFC